MPLRPNTPATLIILAGAVLLSLATLSTPIIKPIHFLTIQLTPTTLTTTTLSISISLGTFGYCLSLGTQLACSAPHPGYVLQLSSLPITLPPQIDPSTLNTTIATLTYALILHPIAAGLALLSAIFGLVSHIREYSRSCYTSCLSSLASTAALLAFLLDIIAFTIAKNRLNAIANPSFSVKAELGHAVWITLAGWLCLTLSGLCFCAGRCLFARRQRTQAQADQLRPTPDQEYIDQMRIDAHQAEKAREKEQASLRNQASLPAFAEYPEHIPLNRFNPNEDEQTTAPYSDHQQPPSAVRLGYRPSPPAHHPSLTSSHYSDSSNLPPHVSPASNTMNPPHRTPSSLTNRRLPQSLIPAGGMAHTNASNTPPGSYSSNAIHPPNSYPSTPPSSSSTLAAKPSLVYPSYDRLLTHNQRQHPQQQQQQQPAQQYHPGYRGQPAYYPAGPQPSHQASLDSTHRPRPLPSPQHTSPGPQPIHQASIDSAHRAFPHQPYQTQPLYPAQNTLSEEPDQLPDPNPQYPFGQNINLSDQYPSSQNMHLSPSGHQLDTNRSTVYSQATSVPFVPQPRDAQDPGTRFAGYPADGRSTVYSQATTAAPLGAPEQPQPYGHHPHVSASAPGQEPDEHDMYGGTEALSYRPEIGNPVPRHPLPHPPSLPPLSFSPAPTLLPDRSSPHDTHTSPSYT
ncbi:hypothetical protein PTTG_07544 [Puccinia triticina 1-1 BBBD Race 1]|uniref:Uncharacterized protein n=1 Tax=Puccinia triticina (isolate 1-1 / race 1 (BBBD)) TaxID=630390 RepID=A0A180GEG5_PUCT1|nr:hypothetical protein PTTG_07544 [Puccinia triticina 1-1 BBBD Race 1]